MSQPSLDLFTTPHKRGRSGNGKWASFFSDMKYQAIQCLPDELQDKKSVHGYVPADIRKEFVFRTASDGKRYVARLTAEVAAQVKPQRKQAAAATTPVNAEKPAAAPVQRMAPPAKFDD